MDENLIDPEEWEMFTSIGDLPTINELLDLFLSDSPELIEQMRSGIAESNIEQVRRAAHSLKSNSASFGARKLSGASRDLEMLAKGGSLNDAASKLDAIEAEYTQLLPELARLRNELE